MELWGPREQVALLQLLPHYPPCGPSGEFNLLLLRENLRRALGRPVGVEEVLAQVSLFYRTESWASRLDDAEAARIRGMSSAFSVPDELPDVFFIAQRSHSPTPSPRAAPSREEPVDKLVTPNQVAKGARASPRLAEKEPGISKAASAEDGDAGLAYGPGSPPSARQRGTPRRVVLIEHSWS